MPERASRAGGTSPSPNGRAAGAPDPDDVFDVVIIGAGPAGLSAGLNLVRARRRVLMLDSNRPRHSATLKSHGFLTRDGVSPLELRKLGREEFEHYPEATFHQALVTGIERVEEPPATATEPAANAATAATPATPAVRPAPAGELFVVRSKGIRGSGDRTATTRAVLIATGLTETLPALPGIRTFYGTDLHSCTECDGYEKSDEPLALIGETDDLAERALLLSQWSNDLIVFTNGVAELTAHDEAALDARGIGVERRPIASIEGDRTGMTGVALTDGTVILRSGGFLRPVWTPALDYGALLGVDTDDDALLVTDALGRTSVPGVFAAGDSTPPGAQQLVVAAGDGARVAATINRHLIGVL
ncbi:pyridine nucleotide-disulfide oxidoreductase [Subtercola boreus]|uniref:Pyridine nucleotide-disulfide oxidoreductase n=1 Tax=Subtercola boreus TaxID=120213 RepID=A0A3E0VMY6_9MICO|nr:pyridine nucleotide-disulfide oxidoreductase [Subtercola boreus]